jgi:pyruvate dehydrogenase complex dehydrogenase (E1) component
VISFGRPSRSWLFARRARRSNHHLRRRRIAALDGSRHALAATTPNGRAYDPTFAYELVVTVDLDTRQMIERQRVLLCDGHERNLCAAHSAGRPRDDIVKGTLA